MSNPAPIEEKSRMTLPEEESLGNMEGVLREVNYCDETDTGILSDVIPQQVMQSEELNKTLDFGAENTHFMTMENMMDLRYMEFNKALTDLACLVDTYSADKKTIKYIKNEYVKIYMKYFDVVKYIYGLDVSDSSIVPGTSADKVLFKREVVEPKRIKLDNGEKLHIYENKDGKYQFIDEIYMNGTGITLRDIAFWLENRDNFTDNYILLENVPTMITIFGRSCYVPTKGLRIPRNGNIMLERFYAILSRLYKQIGDMLSERKKTLAAKGHTHASDDDVIEDSIEDDSN